MIAEIFDSTPTHSVKAQEQKFKRIITPLLEKLIDEADPKEITIDTDNNLCINSTPIGDYRLISNFSADNQLLSFDYESNGKRQRLVSFGMKYFEPDQYFKVFSIAECANGETTIIYEREL